MIMQNISRYFYEEIWDNIIFAHDLSLKEVLITGNCYEYGIGAPPNLVLAVHYYVMAASCADQFISQKAEEKLRLLKPENK